MNSKRQTCLQAKLPIEDFCSESKHPNSAKREKNCERKYKELVETESIDIALSSGNDLNMTRKRKRKKCDPFLPLVGL